MKAVITDEMRRQAKIESNKRVNHIRHHFNVSHLSYSERDEIGFLGEFACCDLLGIDWRKNIRENYYTIDSYDIIVKNLKADIKTDTVPLQYTRRIIDKSINNNEKYCSRLIHKGQFNLLSKYDIVIFGIFIREQLDYWYPIGYLETETIIRDYPPTYKRPDGGTYPFPGSPIPTSILKPFENLL